MREFEIDFSQPKDFRRVFPDSIIGGGRNPIWRVYDKFFKSFIDQEKLKPAKMEVKVEGKEVPIKHPWWIYGGMINPHIHLDENVFLISDEMQFSRFTKGLVSEFNSKVDIAKDIQFSELIDVAMTDIIDRIK